MQIFSKKKLFNSDPVMLWDWIFLGSLIILTSLISCLFLLNQSLRLDESQSLWQSSHTLRGLITTISQDVHVPLYPVILFIWQRLAGNSEAVSRLPSLFFFLLSIPALFYLGSHALSKKVARFACLLFSISPFLNWYGNEARMYSLLTFITILNQYVFLKLTDNLAENKVTKKNWAIYVLTCIFGIYTHYFFWLVLLTQAIYFLLYYQSLLKIHFLKFLGVFALVSLAFIPWILQVLSAGFFSNTAPLIFKPSYLNLFNGFAQFIFGFQTENVNTALLSMWPLLMLILFFFLQKNNKITKPSAFFLLTAFVPPILVFFLSLTLRPIFVTRYFIFTIPSLYLFFSWLVISYSNSISKIIRLGLVASMVVTLYVQNTKAETPVKENYKQAASYLSQNSSSQDLILVSAPFTIYPLEYYFQGPARLTTTPSWNRYEIGSMPPFSLSELEAQASNYDKIYQNIWLVLSYNQGYEAQVKKYFDEHYQKTDEVNFSNGLNLYEYKFRYAPPISLK